MLATRGDLVEIRLRDDAAEWKALAERLEARRVLDVSTGLEGLPDEGEYDLIVAPNDPFAGIIDDDARAKAIAKTRGLLARDGLLVIEGLYVPPQEDAVASAPDGLARERRLDDGSVEREVWRALGEHQYEVHTNGSRPLEFARGTAARALFASRGPASRVASTSVTSTRGATG